MHLRTTTTKIKIFKKTKPTKQSNKQKSRKNSQEEKKTNQKKEHSIYSVTVCTFNFVHTEKDKLYLCIARAYE